MNKFIFLLSLILIFSGCIQPTEAMIREAIAKTELAGIYKKTDIAATEQAKATITPTITVSPTITLTPTITLSPTITLTPTATMKPAQMTATVVQATKEYLDLYKIIAWKELKNYPDNHSGEKIKIKGKIFQIIDSIDMLLWYPGTYDAFYVSFSKSFSGVYEDQTITIYGIVDGNYCYDTQAGGSNCVPLISGVWFVK